jgi:hypothetical protein
MRTHERCGARRLPRHQFTISGALAVVLVTLCSILAPPMVRDSRQVAYAAFTLPPAPWGEFTPFYGAAPCIPDFQDVGIFSPADAKADAMVDKLLKKRILGEEDVQDIRKFDAQDRDRRANRNFYGNLSYRMQFLYNYFEGDSKAPVTDPNLNETSATTTIPSRTPLFRPSSSGSNTLYGGSRENVHDFDVRRFRFQFSGCVYRDMQFHIEFHADGHSIGLRDMDAAWTRFPWMNVMIGQIKMPNSRERQLSSGAIHFPERAFASQGIAAIGRETGVQLSGMDIYDLVDYKVMAAAGYGFNKQFQQYDDTSNWVYAGRLTMHPFGRVPFWAGDVWNSWAPLFEVSATFAYGPKALAMGELNAIQSFDMCAAYGGIASAATRSATVGCTRPTQAAPIGAPGFTQLPIGRENFHQNAIGDWKDMGFDATFMYRGFYANVEYHNMTYTPNNGNRSLTQFPGLRTLTYAVDLGYFLIPREWELVARYQYVDINKGEVNIGGYNTSSTSAQTVNTGDITNRKVLDQRWWEFGSVWYLSRDHRHKLGVFGHIRKEAGIPIHNNGGSINLQVAF